MLPRSAGEVLAEHVTLEVECIDRMYLNLYQPKLQHELGVVGFFKGHRGYPFVSSALMDPISRSFVAAIHQFVEHEGVPLVHFARGNAKTTSPTSTWPASPAPKGCCLSGGRRKRPWPTAPRSAATRSPGPATRGWCAARRWSTTSTSTPSTLTSARSSSSSRPTSPTTPSCASTATSGPSGRPSRRASPTSRSTTAFCPALTPPGCRRCATPWAPPRSEERRVGKE